MMPTILIRSELIHGEDFARSVPAPCRSATLYACAQEVERSISQHGHWPAFAWAELGDDGYEACVSDTPRAYGAWMIQLMRPIGGES